MSRKIEFDRSTTTVQGRPVDFCRLPEPVGEFVYVGRIDGNSLELWTELGRWRESGAAHPYDLALVAQK